MKSNDYLLLLDADDTLWESALFFERTEHDFLSLMTALGSAEEKVRRIVHRKDVERLSITGYGAKPYMDTLRMIMLDLVPEAPSWALTAMDDIQKNLLGHPVILLPGVLSTLEDMKSLPVKTMVYTMGKKNHQTDKFIRSGLNTYVDELRIVPRKSVNALRGILTDADVEPRNCIIVGNSPRSDINPALSLGAVAVHLLRDRTWAAEREDFIDPGMVITIENLKELSAIIRNIVSN
ncbi:MAG: HAD family hydrolase [Candidatus Aegiribacteria sp.]|nr:HAD family hydrolase [Candidatus Aegiribacteria sp.]